MRQGGLTDEGEDTAAGEGGNSHELSSGCRVAELVHDSRGEEGNGVERDKED